MDAEFSKPEFSNRTKAPNRSKFYAEFAEVYPVPHHEFKYGWIYRDPVNVLRSAALFGSPGDFLPDYECFYKAVEGVLSLFAPILNRARVVATSEVVYNSKASSGVLGKMFDTRTKKEFYERFPEAVEAFWHFGHISNWFCLWKQTGKEEVTKSRKLIENEIRSFLFSDPLLWFMGARTYTDQNHLLESMGFPIAIGWSKYYGGAELLARYLAGCHIERGDAKRYDRNLNAEFFHAVMIIRWLMFKEEFRTPEMWLRHVYLYTQILYTYSVLPNGQVIWKCSGNPSGSWNTSYDNEICHLIIRAYCWIRTTGHSCDEYWRTVRLVTYADDYVEGTTDEHLSIGYTPERKVECYGELGHTLTLEQPSLTDDLNEVEFLGAFLHHDTLDGWVMRPSRPAKILYSLEFPPRKEDLDLAFTRCLALWVEGFYDPNVERVARQYRDFLSGRGAKMISCDEMSWLPLQVFTTSTVRRLWTGRENA